MVNKNCPECGGTGIKVWGEFDDIYEEPCHCTKPDEPETDDEFHDSAVMLGRLGGQSKSEAKIKASKENGKKGGYPKGRPRTKKPEWGFCVSLRKIEEIRELSTL
jgi:hypothetical protein